MLNVFLLITKRADFMMRQASFGKAVRSPTSIVDGYPNEEFATERRPTLPYPPPGSKFNSSYKKCSIGRLAAIYSIM